MEGHPDHPVPDSGQGVTLVTPIAVARYVSAIANKGTVYDAHIADRVLDSEGNLVEEFEPTVYNEIDIPDAVWDAVYEGMKGVVSPEDGGTAANYFSTEFREKIPFPIPLKSVWPARRARRRLPL